MPCITHVYHCGCNAGSQAWLHGSVCALLGGSARSHACMLHSIARWPALMHACRPLPPQAASDVISPVSGEVTDVNSALADDASKVWRGCS